MPRRERDRELARRRKRREKRRKLRAKGLLEPTASVVREAEKKKPKKAAAKEIPKVEGSPKEEGLKEESHEAVKPAEGGSDTSTEG